MATIKSYTDLEQSKVLAKILPLESADMHYYKNSLNDYIEALYNSNDLKEGFELNGMEYVPCWSLAALLSILPQPHLERFDENTWICSTFNKNNHFIDNASKNDPVDACCEMIIKLHEEFKNSILWIAQEQAKRS